MLLTARKLKARAVIGVIKEQLLLNEEPVAHLCAEAFEDGARHFALHGRAEGTPCVRSCL